MAETLEAGAPAPRIAAVGPGAGLSVSITWENGRTDIVDLSPLILGHKAFKPLRNDPALFAQVAVEEYGCAIRWSDTLDMANYTLQRLADQQRIMTTAEFNAWRERNRLTLDVAAAVLGISRRVVAAMSSGERPMDLTTTLACRGYEAAGRAAE
jgi:hypothetical protein